MVPAGAKGRKSAPRLPEPLQLLRPDGTLAKGAQSPVSMEDTQAIYRAMVRLRTIDERMLTLQRQGRIGFYGAATGQEAATIGSGWPLEPQDWVFPALREGGVALLRGYPIQEYTDQIFGNGRDVMLGRQMPCHYVDRPRNFVSLSPVIGTQLPQAVGTAMAMQMRGDQSAVIGYMGDGATSEGDFHVACNFAGVYRAPVVLFCQNNQWAISVPFEKQTAASSIAIKARAYGIAGVQCDGNDVLAVIAVTQQALAAARKGDGPTLIEAITYRVGAHTTSDDPSRYRDESITEEWKKLDPIERLRLYLEHADAWSEADEESHRKACIDEINGAIASAESAPPPALDSLVEEVYSEITPALSEQLAELRQSLPTS